MLVDLREELCTSSGSSLAWTRTGPLLCVGFLKDEHVHIQSFRETPRRDDAWWTHIRPKSSTERRGFRVIFFFFLLWRWPIDCVSVCVKSKKGRARTKDILHTHSRHHTTHVSMSDHGDCVVWYWNRNTISQHMAHDYTPSHKTPKKSEKEQICTFRLECVMGPLSHLWRRP